MRYIEEHKNLFLVNELLRNGEEPYCFAHCISSEFAMAGGIAVQFNQWFDMKNRLIKQYGGSTVKQFGAIGGLCIPMEVEDHKKSTYVFNLVTKKWVTNRPTYFDLKKSLEKTKDYMIEADLHRLAMPTIGCGIDGLCWDEVRDIIHQVFKDTDVEVKICMR